MHIYQIRQKSSRAILWTGAALDPQSALDAMAREAGYRDFDGLPETLRAQGFETADLG
ncbi:MULTISPECIES: hypothetical protein [Methylobacterium]|uniref:Uncharacterized protein n=1 Tax=Methylobacterium jeotgali TaxID=381630 RepID=A0ABQ4STM4_9HYPH|nr:MULTISPECIES: hypothetical protein [Methylobacterium]GBU19097.1 hypothetical protein AwMethylo_33120 [Methylobacterium sp.]GJE06442.1 hypothetical protein AOPFMNJM_1761 [Methylobacterium jeotgali]